MVVDLGLRLFSVVVRKRTWSGGTPGRGTATNTDLTLEPRPRVRPPSSRRLIAEPGRFEDGDRMVDRISATYTAEQLGQIPTGGELLYLIDGEAYRLVGAPLEQTLGWSVQLRRTASRP